MPIIIVSARSTDVDKLAGLAMGADDYVTKPCRLNELVARIRAVLRRTLRPEAAGLFGMALTTSSMGSHA